MDGVFYLGHDMVGRNLAVAGCHMVDEIADHVALHGLAVDHVPHEITVGTSIHQKFLLVLTGVLEVRQVVF